MSNDLIISDLKNKIANSENDFILSVKIISNAKTNSIEKFCENTYKIRVSQVAVDGKANKEIIKFLSDILKIPKTKISIIKGEFTNHKDILIKK